MAEQFEKVSDGSVKITLEPKVITVELAALKAEVTALDVEIAKVQAIKSSHVSGWDAEIARLISEKAKVQKRVDEAVKLGIKEAELKTIEELTK